MRADDGFPKLDRFEFRRRLGSGGFGVVFEAWDHERGAPVALKRLKRAPAGESLIRFKNEWRRAQGLHHPNLVRLYEFMEVDRQWFFTMELVTGINFIQWVRSSTDRSQTSGHDSPDFAYLDTAEVRFDHFIVDHMFNLDRLRRGLIQLSSGIHELHRQGIVHRDIKPSNILVAHPDRVVLLDFGLAAPIGQESPHHTVGTPLYMAPEQANSRLVGPAADWYSVGVILFEALTGRLPFSGKDVLADKSSQEPPVPVSSGVPMPEDLLQVCMGLLQRRPKRRLAATQILATLGADGALRSGQYSAAESIRIFVGRERELDRLKASLADVRDHERSRASLLVGESGVGKSELARHFINSLSPGWAVFSSRCYERESLPYKAVDGIIDDLSVHIAALPSAQSARLVPRDASLLLRVFPALQRVRALCEAPPIRVKLSPQDERVRVFAALRELFERLAITTDIVLHIDDLQWADEDSLALLRALTDREEAPPFFLLATILSTGDDSGAESKNESMNESMTAIRDVLHVDDEIRLAPLSMSEAKRLAQMLLKQFAIANPDAMAVAIESGGHPLFLAELVRQSFQTGDEHVALDDAIARRIHRLDGDARLILELLAVASRPLTYTVAMRAAELSRARFRQQIDHLRSQMLVRTGGRGLQSRAEPYHRLVRQVATSLRPERHAFYHERLALALEAVGETKPEELMFHWRNVGKTERALELAVQAAEQSAGVLAFERAAHMYREAIALCGDADQRRGPLRVHLGDALANAGLGASAAAEYARAIDLFDEGETRVALQHKRADQLLRSGYVEEGIRAMEPILAASRLPLPKSPRRAVFSFLRGRMALALRHRGLHFRERDPDDIPAEVRARLALCWSAAIGLFTVDQIRGLDYHVRHLRMALSAGAAAHVARGFGLEVCTLVAIGADKARVEALLARGRELATRLDDAYGLAWIELGLCTQSFMTGRWESAHKQAQLADRILEEQCTGVAQERTSALQISVGALSYLGRFCQLASRVRSALQDAVARGDRYAGVCVRSGLANIVWLRDDDVAEARKQVAQAVAEWSQSGFHLQTFFNLFAEAQIDLYEGDGAEALRRLDDRWPTLAQSGLLRVTINRIMMIDLRARAALAVAANTREQRARETLCARVSEAARTLHRETAEWAHALAASLDAQLVFVRDRAEPDWAACQARFDKLDMQLHAAACQSDFAAPYFADEGIRNPERLCAMLLPARSPLAIE